MQESFTDELRKLQAGRCQSSGERWFASHTGSQAAAVAIGQYICDRCKRDKAPVKSFFAANDMDPGTVPVQLQALTQAKEMLVAKGCPVMRVYHLKGGQQGYGGHVVNLAQNVGDFVERLPRAAKDLPIVVVRRLAGKDTHTDLLVPRQGVFDAISLASGKQLILQRYQFRHRCPRCANEQRKTNRPPSGVRGSSP